MIHGVAVFCALVVLVNFSSVVSSTGKYTGAETKALEKFRTLVEPELYRDFMKRDEYLIRWIRDQDFDLEKAQQKLLTSIKWRKDNNVDSVLNEDFSEVERVCPYTKDGVDKTGRPVGTMSLGSCPLRRILLNGNIEKLHRMIYFVCEYISALIQEVQSQGKNVTDGIVIVDINNFNLREHFCIQCVPIAIDAIALYDSNYPRYLHAVYAINVPRVAHSLFAIILPFLSEDNRKRIHLYGYDRQEWKAALLEIISPDQLEPQFGGTKKPVKFVPVSGPDGRKIPRDAGKTHQ